MEEKKIIYREEDGWDTGFVESFEETDSGDKNMPTPEESKKMELDRQKRRKARLKAEKKTKKVVKKVDPPISLTSDQRLKFDSLGRQDQKDLMDLLESPDNTLSFEKAYQGVIDLQSSFP